MNSIKILFAATIVTAGIGGPGIASAGVCTSGFLADVACLTGLVSPREARQLDRAHRAIGRPLNHLNPLEQRGSRPTPSHIGGHFAGGPPMGNRCLTVYGVSGPGPWNPLGSPCFMGNAAGYVVR